MRRSSNPALNDKIFINAARNTTFNTNAGVMTIDGTVNKTWILLFLMSIPAIYTWQKFFAGGNVNTMLIGGGIGGFIIALITVFKPHLAPKTAPLYAIAEGFFIGAISATFEKNFPGIVIQATALTFGVLFSLLAAYRSGLIKATENFKLGVFAATASIGLIYLVSIILGFFNISIPLIHGSGTIGIIFSLVVVVVAALNLVMDFDFIENGAKSRAPKYMEWYGAFGLMVTLIWLYLELLRLLAKLNLISNFTTTHKT